MTDHKARARARASHEVACPVVRCRVDARRRCGWKLFRDSLPTESVALIWGHGVSPRTTAAPAYDLRQSRKRNLAGSDVCGYFTTAESEDSSQTSLAPTHTSLADRAQRAY